MSSCNPLIGKVPYVVWKTQSCPDRISALLKEFDYTKPYNALKKEDKKAFKEIIQTYYDSKKNNMIPSADVSCYEDILKQSVKCLEPEVKKPLTPKQVQKKARELYQTTELQYSRLLQELKTFENKLTKKIDLLNHEHKQKELDKRKKQRETIQKFIQNTINQEKTYRVSWPQAFPEAFPQGNAKNSEV